MYEKWQNYKPEKLHSKPCYYEVGSEEFLIEFKGMLAASILHLYALNPLLGNKPLEVRVRIFLPSSTELSPAIVEERRPQQKRL